LLIQFVPAMEAVPAIRNKLLYTCNPVYLQIGGRYYFENRNGQNRVAYISIMASSAAHLLLTESRAGVPYEQLKARLQSEIPEATAQEASAYIDTFIDYGLLQSRLLPPLTASDPIDYILDQLTGIREAEQFICRLREIKKKICRYDLCRTGHGGTILAELQTEADLAAEPGNTNPLPLTVDLALNFSDTASVQQSVANDAAEMASLYFQLSSYSQEQASLLAFRHKFIARYGEHRLVPLLEVLNPDIGLGVPAHYHSLAATKTDHSWQLSPSEVALLNIAVNALQRKSQTIHLDTQTLHGLINPHFDPGLLPESLDFSLHVIAESERAVNNGTYQVLAGTLVGAPEAGQTAGRFADMLGQETVRYLQGIAAGIDAANAEALHAELL